MLQPQYSKRLTIIKRPPNKVNLDIGGVIPPISSIRKENRLVKNKAQNKFLGGKSRYFFLAPGAAIYLVVIILPALYTLILSFYQWNGMDSIRKFVGFENYKTLFTTDYIFGMALKNNAIWILMTTVLTVGVSLLFAMLINKQFCGRIIIRGVLYFPYILSGTLVGIIWVWVYQYQFGLYNGILEALNLIEYKKAWLSDPNFALYAVFLADFWNSLGGPMILFLAGLQTIPSELQEAARVDGAGRLRVFLNITIPQLKETFVIVFATQIIRALKVYDMIRAMTDGGPANSTDTLATLMVIKSFDMLDFGGGAAVAMVMTVFLMIVIIPYILAVSKD